VLRSGCLQEVFERKGDTEDDSRESGDVKKRKSKSKKKKKTGLSLDNLIGATVVLCLLYCIFICLI